MTKIAFFHPAFETPGGAESLCVEEARFLQEAGEDISLVTLGFDPSRWARKVGDIPVRVIQKRKWTDLLSGFSRLAKLSARGKRASQVLKGFEVVVAHNYPCNAMLGGAGLTARTVWQCNEPPRNLHAPAANPRITRQVEQESANLDASSREWRATLARYKKDAMEGGKLWDRIQFDLASTANLDHIFAISEFSRDNARAIYGRCGEEVVYPMVRFPRGGRTRSGLDRSGLQVLTHSRLETMKNIDTVIRGFARFQASHPGAHLHIVGDGAAKGELERISRELLPDGSATFHGYLPDDALRAVYERCDVLALLTIDEPFGMVFPEAAAKGLLLVGPDHGGPYEILDGGRLGWCLDPFAPEALAQALEEVWALPDAEADRKREAADTACRARFSREVIGPQLRRVILEGHG